MELFQMPNRGINASGLQYMAPEMCIGSIVGIETSSKCSVSILPGEEII
jgi:hypothetical protein